MTRFAVEWEATYPPEFGGGQGWVVSADAARRAEAERDRYRDALESVDVALGYLDATPLDDPVVRAAHLASARDVVATAFAPDRPMGDSQP